MYSITNLHDIILWIAAAVSLIVSGLLLYSLVRFRRKPAGDAESEQSFHDSALLEAIWMLIPVGILVALLVLTFQTIQRSK